MARVLTALVLCNTLAIPQAGWFEWGAPETNVTELTAKNFAGHLRKHPLTLAKFYAPWCGHCKEMAPAFEEAAGVLKLQGVSLVSVDADKHKELKKQYEVENFPTLLWLERGSRSNFGGERTARGIVQGVSKLIGPPVEQVVEPPEPGKVPLVVLRAPSLLDGFSDAARANRTQAAWYFVSDTSGPPRVVLQHKGEDPFEMLEGVDNKDQVSQFLTEHIVPLFGRLDSETFARYNEGHGLVWTLFPVDKDQGGVQAVEDKLRPMMVKVAKNFVGRYHVTVTDTGAFKENIDRMLGVKTFPAIAIQPKAGSKTKYVYTGEMQAEAIIDFIKAADAGQVAPFIMSEPAPPATETLVKVLVGDTLEQEAMAEDRDVFVKIYAPWCGACKAFEPEYKKFAKFVRSRKMDDLITVAKIDATANDVPVKGMEYTGFPTLYFVPAGSGASPVRYEGERTAKAMWAWTNQHTGKKDEIKRRKAETKKGNKKEEASEL